MEVDKPKPALKWAETYTVHGPAGLTDEQAIGWMKAQTTPEIIYPDDCGRPHQWEKFTVADNQCGCGLCGNGLRYWMECANCLTVWDIDPERDKEAWENAPWG